MTVKDGGGRDIKTLAGTRISGLNHFMINLGKVPNGLYFLKIRASKAGKNENVVVKKIVIKKQ